MSEGKAGRRRRSSSVIIYKEPPESPEQLSDQAALPNRNASWVNGKGMDSPRRARKANIRDRRVWLTLYDVFRSMGNPHRPYRHHEDCPGRRTGHVAGDELDTDQYLVHGRLVPHVPLCAGRPI